MSSLVSRYIIDLDNLTELINANKTNLILLGVFLVIAIRQFSSQVTAAKAAGAHEKFLPAPDFPEIQPISNFKWKTTEPEKIYPFKPKYHLTMALQSLDPSELINMDKNYADRIKYRKDILKEYPDISHNISNDPRIAAVVREFYTFMLGTYLPRRYPDMFKIHFVKFESGDQFMFENTITNEVYPAKAPDRSDPRLLLLTLGKTLDEDFLFLLPEEEGDEPKYVLEAFVTCCPSGFNTYEKMGKRLADIHAPVPGYGDKIGKSMDKYFNTLEVGKHVKRANWAITTHSDLFVVPNVTKNQNHAKEEDESEAPLDQIVDDEAYLRVERQTLQRLPASKAIVFAFKTYLYPLKDIRSEGLGEDLAEAIDGMKGGSVSDTHVYKRAAYWGEAVKTYLRSKPENQ